VEKARVERRPEALEDLAALSDYLDHEAGLEVAIRFLEAADAAFVRLSEMPQLGATREFSIQRLEGFRMWPIPDFPNHLIFYRPTVAGIEIVRVLHAARDIPEILE